jgi:alpha-glucosidase
MQPIHNSLSPEIDAAPSLKPTILDDTAPDPQACPGYKASNVVNGTQGFTANLTIAGTNCQAYGNDIADLTLEVSYQAKGRLNVRIYPKYLVTENVTQYLIPGDIVLQPCPDGETTESTSDLVFEWSNEPSFQFQVSRTTSGEVLFSSYGHVIVFEDQFIQVVTNMVDVRSFTIYRSIH